VYLDTVLTDNQYHKVALHACEVAGQQVTLTTGETASDTTISVLIPNIGVLNVNSDAAGLTSKRSIRFTS